MRSILVEKPGNPGALTLAEVPDPQPTSGFELVRVTRAGVNFRDLHMRENGYLEPVEYPFTPGCEVVGVAADGRRVAALVPSGAYAEKVLAPKDLTWDIPDDVSDEQACALTLQGQSAYHMLFTTLDLQRGETVLVPAAAGGLGSLAVQLAKAEGIRVIALEAGESRQQLARTLGADAVVDSSTVDELDKRITEAAGGRVDAALAVAGSPALSPTLKALTPRGRMAVFGCASGKYDALLLDPLVAESKTIRGFWLRTLFADPDYPFHLMDSMEALCGFVRSGQLQPLIGPVHDLSTAIWAHLAVDEGRTCQPAGKIMLDPTRPDPSSPGVTYETRPATPPFSIGWGGL
ncbi:zinc-binding dehydrogenase [Streptomyces olivoreticuli]|uniref:quinone oxidoreductase family protein n=1 Tax=Streptomyces olivoreticuli TaxID=68246 RepID=UPI002657EB85|nr:zinc-binding dehydrogenase [Streptomyces olivoreticuli]WKK23047.1 zinc-binding dehydrogenase [Streptomyces olivoreticuli]